MATRVTGTGPEEMKLLAARLREAPKSLRSKLRKEFRAAAGPTVRRVQASILDMPSVHGSVPGKVPLREAIARTVTASAAITASGVRLDIVSYGTRMPRGEQSLPKHTDSARGWGHPVFARRGRDRVWVHQHGKTQWFEDPIARSARAIQDACQRAMDSVARELDH